MRHPDSQVERDCCRQLFFAHYVDGDKPLVVLECTRCGRFWHKRQDGTLVPYDRSLLPAVRSGAGEGRSIGDSVTGKED